MLKCKVCGKSFEVKEVKLNNETEMYVCNKCNSDLVEFETAYNVGDKVIYIDIYGNEKDGTVLEIDSTDINDWNDEIKPLYLITGSPYLRSEDEVFEYFEGR